MAIYSKRYYWGFKKYNNKTGMYKGETKKDWLGNTIDWKDNKIEEAKPYERNLKTGYED